MLPHHIPSLLAVDCGLTHPLVLLYAIVVCCSTPLLHSPQCHGQALATKGPVQRSLMVPMRMCRLGCRLAPYTA
jgi:hypothetical protein